MAPISTPPSSVSEMPRSSATPPRSITASGRLIRSLNQSKVSSPPANTQPWSPCSPMSRTASSTPDGW